MNPSRADILAAVNHEAGGFTTAELIHRIGGTSYSVSAALSKLYAYGKITVEITDRYPKTYRWMRLHSDGLPQNAGEGEI